ncbi:general transcription factor II-I repeat domain-containing 2A-like protein [Trichonephila clavipes]|nr:general transcription factor II-I repeat domain-containing 2A-like protein [Trichonephila clavipes]
MQGSFDTHFPLKSELRIQKLKEFIRQQSSFVKLNTLSKAPTVASLRVSHLLAKHKKPFADGEIIKKKCFSRSQCDSLFDSFKNKTEIISAIKDIQLSHRTVTRRIEMNSDLANQLTKDITNCICFSLQFDESVHVIDVSQPCIFVRMVFQDMSIKEELLTILPLKKKTRGEDVY